MTKLIQIIVLFIMFNCYGQKSISLKGKVHFNNKALSEVHIFNRNTSKGTITDVNGLFKLQVNLGDVLLVTAMPYKEQYITITNTLFELAYIDVNLLEDINTLNEVVIDSRKLTGNLFIDSKKTPKNANSPYKVSIDINDYDLSLIPDTGSGFDRGDSELQNKGLVGANLLGAISLLVNVIKPEKIVRQKPNHFSKETPSLMRKELGDQFFIKELKVPKPQIDDFLEEYCGTQEFIDLYEENKIIECIEFLIDKNKLGKYSLANN